MRLSTIDIIIIICFMLQTNRKPMRARHWCLRAGFARSMVEQEQEQDKEISWTKTRRREGGRDCSRKQLASPEQ